MNTDMTAQLNTLLADAVVLYYKMHNYHWFVTGPAFFTLHEQFEERYTAWSEHLDQIAERILQIGGKPHGTLAACLKASHISEETETLDATTMVARTIDDLKGFNERMTKTMRAADEAGDRSTSNLLDDISDEIEKAIWMFSARNQG